MYSCQHCRAQGQEPLNAAPQLTAARSQKETTFFIYSSSPRTFSCCWGSSRDRTPGEGTESTAQPGRIHTGLSPAQTAQGAQGQHQHRVQEVTPCCVPAWGQHQHGVQEVSPASPTLPWAHPHTLLAGGTSPWPQYPLRTPLSVTGQAHRAAPSAPGCHGAEAFPGSCFCSWHSLPGPGLQGFSQIQGLGCSPVL